jgi:penicillin-binding protein 1A
VARRSSRVDSDAEYDEYDEYDSEYDYVGAYAEEETPSRKARQTRDEPKRQSRTRSARGAPRAPKRGFVRRLFRKLFLGGLGFLVLLVGVGYLYVRFAPVPPDKFPVQTTFIFDANGQRLAALSAGENREVLAIADIPLVLQNAVVAAEDRSFYRHRGVDPRGIARAVWQAVRHRGRQGGSTITQQYVKNVYVGREATFSRKLKEAAIAIKLEQKLTKDQILERYLNTIYFGRGAYGVQAASRAYFGTPVSKLDLPKAAYLAAVIRSPEHTDAIKDPDVAKRRRDSVLAAMLDTGTITPAQATSATTVALAGPGGVRPRNVRGTVYDYPKIGTQWFVDAVRKELVDRFGEQVVQTQGLKVKTSLDLKIQKRAYEAAYRELLPKADDPSAAVVVLDHDAHVKALVGGRSWADSKVNLALGSEGGGEGRAAGSVFKPFVLAAMVHNGFSLESAFRGPATITIPSTDGGEDWVVRNTGRESYGTTNMVDATRLSINTVFAQAATAADIGPERIAEAAEAAGIKSPLAKVPSIALGTSNVSPIEVANAYLTFANHGIRSTPSFVLSVTTADGRSLPIDQPSTSEAMTAAEADAITNVLRGVVRDGTGRAAAVPGREIAGKTGTTNDYRDAWFVGYSPKECCVTAVWMGYPDSQQAMTNVHGIKVSGGTLPARLFSRVMAVATAKGGTFAKAPKFTGELLEGAARASADSGDSGSETRKSTKRRRTTVAVEETEAPAPVEAGGETVETVVVPPPEPDVVETAPTVPPEPAAGEATPEPETPTG